MNIETIIINFQNALRAATGQDEALIKIALHPDVFQRLIMEMHEKHPYLNEFVREGTFHVRGVQILPRIKETF